MSFALENEKQNKKSFLDVQIIGKGKTFTALSTANLTFAEFFTHFDNFLPSAYNFDTV